MQDVKLFLLYLYLFLIVVGMIFYFLINKLIIMFLEEV